MRVGAMGTSHMQCRRRSEERRPRSRARARAREAPKQGLARADDCDASTRNKPVASIRDALLLPTEAAMAYSRHGSCASQNKPGRVAVG
jgi:hypothetical protein